MGYFTSAIGRKQIMAITGLAWSGFVLTHMLGNMLILVSADAYNKYSHALISNPLLPVAEIGLVVLLLGHIFEATFLTLKNKTAREKAYAMPTQGDKAARFQSKWMAYHGTLILIFIILHLITFKYGQHYMTTVGGVEMRDLHRLVLEVFRQPGYVAWYCFCLVAVGLHLSHGFYSSFSSLGWYHTKYSPWISRFGYLYAAGVAGGFLSQPIYVYFLAK
jgi:succinate dehydrogenase / fumarate reductase cytochrome b subunit